jgi:hypothetical protein
LRQIGITPESRIEEYPGMAFFTFRDPDGNLLMVCGKPGGKEDEAGETKPSAGTAPIRYDAGGCELVVSESSYYGEVTGEGLELTGGAFTDSAYAAPLRIETTLRLQSGCLRLRYGKHGMLTFNYGPTANNGAGDEFYVRHPAVNKDYGYLDKGAIPTGDWVRVNWTIQERSMEVQVNGRLFHTQQGSFGNLVSKAGIGCDNGRITVVCGRAADRGRDAASARRIAEWNGSGGRARTGCLLLPEAYGGRSVASLQR